MKKAVVLLIAVLAISSVYGQFEWVGDYGFSGRVSGFHKTKRNQYIVVRDAEDNAGFTVLDSTGTVIFNYSDGLSLNLPPGGVQGNLIIRDVIELPDSSVAFIMQPFGCNEVSGAGFCTGVQLFDKNWEESTYLSCFDPSWKYGAALSDGTVVIADEAINFARGSAQSGLLWLDTYSLPYIFYDITVNTGDTIFIATSGGTAVLDKEGEIDTLYGGYIFQQLEKTQNGSLLGRMGDSLFLFSSGFELLHSIGFGGDEIVDFDASSEPIAIITASSHVHLMDENLVLLNDFNLPDNNDPGFIIADTDGFTLAQTECYGTGFDSSCAPYLKKINADGAAPDLSKDIGVTNVEVEIIPNEFFLQNGDYRLQYNPLKVTVHNYGDEPVDSLKLNARFETFWVGPVCSYYYQLRHKKFTGLALMPGESVDLDWSNFNIFFTQKPSVPFDICIWASLPDQRLDSGNENDLFCSSGFLVNDEESIVDVSFNIYPNPSSSGSTVNYEFPIGHNTHFRVFNSTGMQVGKFEIENEMGQLLLPKFPTGLYFIALEVEGQVLRTLKFVQM